MKKNDYLKHHAQIMWDIAQEKNHLITIRKKNNDESWLEYYAKEADPSYIMHRSIVNSEAQLYSLLSGGLKFFEYLSLSFETDYIEKIFTKPLEVQDYFLSRTESLNMNISLKSLMNMGEKINLEKVLTQSSSKFAYLTFDYSLEKVFSHLKSNHVNSADILVQYLTKREKRYNQEVLLEIKECLLKYYPKDIEKFKDLAVIKDYLASRNQNIFLDNYDNTYHIRIDLEKVLSQYISTVFLSLNDINENLKGLASYMTDCAKDLGIEKMHVINSQATIKTKNTVESRYSYSNIYISTSEQCLFDRNHFKELLSDYYDSLRGVTPDKERKFEEHIKDWLPSRLRHMHLSLSIADSDKQYKTMKL